MAPPILQKTRRLLRNCIEMMSLPISGRLAWIKRQGIILNIRDYEGVRNEQSVDLGTLYRYLKQFKLSESLFVLSVINSVIRYGPVAVSTDNIPPGTLLWIEENFPDSRKRMELSIHVTRLARFLLLSRADDFREKVLDTGTKEMASALNLVMALYDKEAEVKIESESDLPKVFGRIAQIQFPLQINRVRLFGRGQMLFFDIPSAITGAYDLEAKFEEYFGISIFQFMASGLSMFTVSTGVLKHKLNIEVEALKGVVTPASTSKFVELSSGTQDDYKRLLRDTEWRRPNVLKDIYGLDPLVRMPFIKMGHSLKFETGSYVVPQPLFLLQKATTGIFYLLADRERENAVLVGASGRNDFREAFGEIYRNYVGRHLALARGKVKFIDLDTEVHVSGKMPDFALIQDDTCLLFEVKTAPFSVTTRSTLDLEVARQEIKGGSFKKSLEQLRDFSTSILAGAVTDKRFRKVDKVVSIVVGFEDLFIANPFILPIVKEIHSQAADGLQIASISEIEDIGTLLSLNLPVVPAIYQKVWGIESSEKNDWPLSSTLAEFINSASKKKKVMNPLLTDAFKRLMIRMGGTKEYLEDF